ncbi:MAG TPA: DNRLRE domain-containing protein, partial [Fibrobacteraceae bacterium]|nr:DNRLRE domain-containing protein [Fibrobacteraceae bacterium]
MFGRASLTKGSLFIVGFPLLWACTSNVSRLDNERASDTLAVQPDSLASQDVDLFFAKINGTPSLGDYGTTNGGQRPCASAGAYDKNTVYRSLIRFDLSSIPENAEVLSATLIFHVQGWYTKDLTDTVTLVGHKILKSWKEGTGAAACTEGPTTENSALVNGATAQERYWTSDSSARWNQIGVALDGQDADSAYSTSLKIPYGDTGAVAFDITSLAAAWVADSVSNYGLLLRNLVEVTTAS